MTKTGTSSCVKGLFLSTGDYRIAIDGEAYASGLNYAFFKRYLSVINDLVVVVAAISTSQIFLLMRIGV